MIFGIERVSQRFFREDVAPCDKAFIKEFERYMGTDKIRDKDWFIELNTLEDLLDFKEEIGKDVAISNYFFRYNSIDVKHSIEIYDTYRE